MIEQNKGFERHWYTKLMDRYRWSPVFIPGFNHSARLALRIRYARDKHRVNRLCRGREQEIDDWFDHLELFFGFSSIRGGTVFLTNMLKLQTPNAHIEHEANVVDYLNLPQARLSEEASLEYVKIFRRNEIFSRAPRNIDIYGEINPFIRRHCTAIQRVFPQARLFHMVRDPRDVVRSIMSREIFSRKDPMAALTSPRPSDPYFKQWSSMSRFEKICWEWQCDNRFIRESVPQVIRFEDMMKDYDKFKMDLLDYLKIDLPSDVWASFVNRPKNVSRNYGFEHWSKWDARTMDTFMCICGEEMAEYGYG